MFATIKDEGPGQASLTVPTRGWEGRRKGQNGMKNKEGSLESQALVLAGSCCSGDILYRLKQSLESVFQSLSFKSFQI